MRSVFLVSAILMTAPAVAQTSIQQDYEAAQKALDAKDIAGARARFEALLKRMPPASKSRSMGVVKSRLGAALVLDGEQEAAIPLLTEAMAFFPNDTPEDRGERAEAMTDRARANEAIGAFAAAAADYRAALAMLKPEAGSANDVMLSVGLARSLLWTDRPAARRELDRLIALPGDSWGKNKALLALILALRGRADLIDGRPVDAQPHLRAAMRAAGGSRTETIDLTDVRVRADAAIAAYLMDNKPLHQELVAYSGGGSAVMRGMSSAASAELPACGTSTGLSPDDVAVVEFGIHADGRVRSALPIYVKRSDGGDPAPVAAQFVQAVRSWYWRPDALAAMEPFWRQSFRVEMRCSAVRRGGDLAWTSASEVLAQEFARLGVEAGPPMPANDAAALPLMRADLQRRLTASGPQSVQLALPLYRLAGNEAASDAERTGWIDRAVTILEANGAAPDALAFAKLRQISLRSRKEKDYRKASRDLRAPLLATEVAARPGTRMTQYIRLEQAEVLQNLGQDAEAQALLNAIIESPPELLSRADPIRTSALLRLSNIAAARQDLATAATALAATGLTAEQCALVDVRPKAENASVSASIFPKEASRWGSGGLAKVEYDIGTDGKPVNARTIMAAPPFVFGKPAEVGAGQLRYQPVFRPGNAIGCSGMTQNFRFLSSQ